MYEHFTTVRVRYAETDQMDIVYYGNYAQYFEVGRAECIRVLGFTYKKMEEMGVRMPVVAMEAKFLRPAHYDDLMTIKTILRTFRLVMKFVLNTKCIMKRKSYSPPEK